MAVPPRQPSAIEHIAPILPARNVPELIRFYERLGFHSKRYEGGDDYVFLTRGAQQLHVRRAAEPEYIYNPGGLYLYVTDVDAVYAEVVAAGVPCIHPPANQPWHMREFALSDPEGTLLRIGQRINSAPNPSSDRP